MHVRKARAGTIPGYTWEIDGQVLQLEDALAEELLRMPTAGFSRAEVPEAAEDREEAAQQPEDDIDESFTSRMHIETPEEAAPVKRSGGRPRLPRDKNGNIIRN